MANTLVLNDHSHAPIVGSMPRPLGGLLEEIVEVLEGAILDPVAQALGLRRVAPGIDGLPRDLLRDIGFER